MKPFVNNPAYVSQNASLDNPQPGFSMFQQPFPAPGGSGGGNSSANNQSNGQNNSGSTRTPANQAPKPFSGKGVSVGSNMTGYQGSSSTNTYGVQQNVREEAKGPNPLTQKSKLVKEHYEKNKPAEEETHSDDEDADEHDDLEKNPNKKNDSKGDSDDLLNFST